MTNDDETRSISRYVEAWSEMDRKDRYVDAWGEVTKNSRLDDWSDWEPWQYWRNGFVWIECKEDLTEQDMIAFRDDVSIPYPDGSIRYLKGKRFIIGRIAGMDDDTVYLEVVHCEGQDAYLPETKITRKKKHLTRYGVYRWPRHESPVNKRTEKQITYFEENKHQRVEEDKPIDNWTYKEKEDEQQSKFLALNKSSVVDFTKAAKRTNRKKDIFSFKV